MSTEEPSEIIVEVVRAQDDAQAPARERTRPQHLPPLQLALPRRRAARRAARVPHLWAPFRRGSARAHLAARRSGDVRGGSERSALGRPARVRGSQAVSRAARRRRERDRARRRDGRRPCGDRRSPLRARHHGVPVPRRLHGLGGRREVRTRGRSRAARTSMPADLGRVLRWCAHAGERPRADADGEDDACGRRPATRPASRSSRCSRTRPPAA